MKNKYKHYNLKLKTREKSLSKKNKLIIEEEKTIENDINYMDNLNIMNYFHKLSNTAENNNKKNNSKIILKEIINDKTESNNNNNFNTNNNIGKILKSNLSKNLLNSEKKSSKDNIEFFQNNKLMKPRELNKKIAQKKLIGNNKINITENKEKKVNYVQNFINTKISNRKLIKKNLIKKRTNTNQEKEDLNQNISNSSINRNLMNN